jgi:alkanesulfonate monooxygenase SsuD/methylene tetrahydromethanopterin reductase-like flavin-dependent oxidoreductase (luciferase family)
VSVVRLSCSACGAEANASCSCGEPYVPKLQRAAEAVAAHPEKSNRAIAADIGVSPGTVDRARHKSTAYNEAVDEPRVGRDGKTRKLSLEGYRRRFVKNWSEQNLSYWAEKGRQVFGDPSADADLIDQIDTLFDQLSEMGQVRCVRQLSQKLKP